MKSSKDFLILGHNGYLGNYLINHLDCDILEEKQIYNNGYDYKFVINCIGKPDVKFCEENYQISKYSNADVILDIKKYYPSSKIVNFSSYYVYDDLGLCTESSATSNIMAYARQKLISEKINNDGINFRLGKLFGSTYKQQRKLSEIILSEKTIYLDNVLFNPVSTKCVCDVIKNTNFISDHQGVFNLANDGIVSHYEYGKFIINYLNLDSKIYYHSMTEKPFPNHGNFVMSLDKIKKYIKLNFWQDDLTEYLDCWSRLNSV